MIFKLFAPLLLALLSTDAFPDKAGQCSDSPDIMAAGMGGKNDPNIAWSLTSRSKSYSPGENVKITLTPKANGAKFKGLLLFARAVNNAHLGEWQEISGFQTLDNQCAKFGLEKSTLSHSSGVDKTAPMTFEWTPPQVGLGNVEFRGIVVTGGKTTWMQLSPLLVNGTGTLADGLQSSVGNTTANGTPSGASANVFGNSLMTVGVAWISHVIFRYIIV